MAASNTFADQLRHAIRDSDQSRYRICKETGIDQASLSRFMNGAGLSLDHIERLVSHLALELVKIKKKGN
ncbi:MAG: helix-turn-helix domain-containing protein [Planctomycetales bacterium]|nr:helix-turn-helix domain-containing protein [Planctomycetales bacterium]